MTHPPPSGLALPGRIGGLAGVAANLSWSWNRNARALFRLLDAALWHLTRHNPIELLRRVDAARLAACAADPEFLRLYDAVAAAAARDATSAGTWFAASYPEFVNRPIAYFCAEFGLHASVPIYSGGLGVLAGDQCKAASDLGVPLVGVGLFYTKGYSDQRLRLDGWQGDAEERFDRAATPLQPVRGPKGDPCLATVRMSGRHVSVGAWRVMVGRVPIFLLDTDLEQNDPADRGLCHRLYAGGPELRLRQEWILGVGGVRVLHVLGYDPAAWHANEGHAAFMLVERGPSGHELSHPLDQHEGGVSFVRVPGGRVVSQDMQHSHAAHADDPFLPQPQLGPAGVEPMAEPAVRGIILLEVGIQKKDRDAAHHHTPGADAHVAPGHSDCGEARIALWPAHRLQRGRGPVEALLRILLPSVEP